MSNVAVTVVSVATPLPAGANPSVGIRITLTDSAGNAQTSTVDGVTTTSATFSVVTPGLVTAVAQNVDASGTAIGTPVSGTGTVPAQATFQQPSSITVTVS
jgi:hypothetical protein